MRKNEGEGKGLVHRLASTRNLGMQWVGIVVMNNGYSQWKWGTHDNNSNFPWRLGKALTTFLMLTNVVIPVSCLWTFLT